VVAGAGGDVVDVIGVGGGVMLGTPVPVAARPHHLDWASGPAVFFVKRAGRADAAVKIAWRLLPLEAAAFARWSLVARAGGWLGLLKKFSVCCTFFLFFFSPLAMAGPSLVAAGGPS
jgi:hypothetical protein